MTVLLKTFNEVITTDKSKDALQDSISNLKDITVISLKFFKLLSILSWLFASSSSTDSVNFFNVWLISAILFIEVFMAIK